MAAAVVERSFIHQHTLACSSSSSSGSAYDYSHKKWQTNAHKVRGGTSMQHCLRATGVKTQQKMMRCGSARGNYDPTKKKFVNPVDDPFNFGEDEDMEGGSLMSTGKQSADPRPPKDKNSAYGFVDSPAGYLVETASLGLYVRNDVRRCLCWVAGGVYENLLFFPVIQLLKNRYPGVVIQVVAGERGKQVYEMNKYIDRALVFDTDAEWTPPAELTDFLGMVREVNYDLLLSSTYAGFKHAAMLFMMGGRARRVAYVPKYQSDWVANRYLSEGIEAPRENLAEGGYNMYAEILSYLAQPAKGVPQEEIPPLRIGVNKRVRSVVRQKENEEGLSEGNFVVFHGIESDSAASMTSRGDTDSLLPLDLLGQLIKELQACTRVKVVVVIPHKKERPKVIEACGDDVPILFITTPGQLGALIQDSMGVVCTNTAAMQIAVAMNKPSVVLFKSMAKASLFVPPHAEKIKVVASETGKLADINIDEAISAWRYVTGGQLVLAA